MDNEFPVDPAQHPSWKSPNHKLAGLVVLLIGVVFLLNKIHSTSHWIPDWLFSWPCLFLALGLYVGVKHRFQNSGWFILLLLGAYGLLIQHNVFNFNIRPYALPIGIILLGIFIMLKKNGTIKHTQGIWKRKISKQDAATNAPFSASQIQEANEDVFTASAVLGSVQRNVFSKSFKGGFVNCVFGGVVINLAQSDFEGAVVVEVSVLFGGAEIIIPSNWRLKNEVNVILGGVEDKRANNPAVFQSEKTLILRGNVALGGLEIKSY
jgi:predicted membrane protein